MIAVVILGAQLLALAFWLPLLRAAGKTDCHANAAALARNDRRKRP
jgi:hypothetical protein